MFTAELHKLFAPTDFIATLTPGTLTVTDPHALELKFTATWNPRGEVNDWHLLATAPGWTAPRQYDAEEAEEKGYTHALALFVAIVELATAYHMADTSRPAADALKPHEGDSDQPANPVAQRSGQICHQTIDEIEGNMKFQEYTTYRRKVNFIKARAIQGNRVRINART